MKPTNDQCIALAALFQSAKLVQEIAREGRTDSDAVESSIYSLFQTNPDSVEAVFNGLPGVAIGLHQMVSLMGNRSIKNAEFSRYVISLLHLERKLHKQPKMEAVIRNGIDIAADRLHHFPVSHPNILGQLADLYTATVSTLAQRIMVQGEAVYLQNSEKINQIRSLLLAGIRAARLWRQCGGSRIQIIFYRASLHKIAQELLRQIETQEAASTT